MNTVTIVFAIPFVLAAVVLACVMGPLAPNIGHWFAVRMAAAGRVVYGVVAVVMLQALIFAPLRLAYIAIFGG